MRAPRNTSRYVIRRGSRIRYVGITTNPRRRAGEHRRAGNTGRMSVQGPRVTRKSALKWETRKIAALRGRNGPRSLRNRT